MVENLAPFFADFSVSATVGSTAVRGIFDKGYAEAFGIAAGAKPTLLCKESDLPALTLGVTTVVINAVNYIVAENQTDGLGLTTLTLEAV